MEAHDIGPAVLALKENMLTPGQELPGLYDSQQSPEGPHEYEEPKLWLSNRLLALFSNQNTSLENARVLLELPSAQLKPKPKKQPSSSKPGQAPHNQKKLPRPKGKSTSSNPPVDKMEDYMGAYALVVQALQELMKIFSCYYKQGESGAPQRMSNDVFDVSVWTFTSDPVINQPLCSWVIAKRSSCFWRRSTCIANMMLFSLNLLKTSSRMGR